MKCVICKRKLSGHQTKFCSPKCKSRTQKNLSYKYQQKRAIDRKSMFVAQKGGKCEKCGYNKSLHALSFHHRDPSQKERKTDARMMSSTPIAVMQKEIDKCDLLCLNCHAEVHWVG